jgi:PAS domain S-box-containing protein
MTARDRTEEQEPEATAGSGQSPAYNAAGSLQADRVEQLYSQLPLGILGTSSIGLLTTFELWEQRLHELVMFWWATVLLVSLASAMLYFMFRRSPERATASDQWLRRLGISALANGASWGFAGAVFFPSHTDEQQIFLSFILTGMVSAGIAVYAGSWRIYAVYAAGAVTPFTYVLATFGNRLFTEISVLVPFYFALNTAISYRLQQVFDSGYRLRRDNSTLNGTLQSQLSELQEARRQVEASGRKLALFAERSPISVIELDADARVTHLNQVAEIIFGYASSELIGQHSSILFSETTRGEFADYWARIVANGESLTGIRTQNLRHDGIEITCEWTITPLVNQENLLLSVIAQGQDITQRLEVERMKNEFTSTLSHELRTPLTSIIGSLQLINSGVMGEVDGEIAELTGIAERNSQRLLDLINDLLDIEKIESGKLSLDMETCSIADLANEAMLLNRAFAERYKVSFEAQGDFPNVPVHADRKRLLQVVTNLLSNAAKFSPAGSQVEVAIHTLPTNPPSVRLDVQDRGSGIPENFRSRIFSRFAQADSAMTRQQGGTGLGLAICKRLIELMGGRIGFQDREGGGTTFWLELPGA